MKLLFVYPSDPETRSIISRYDRFAKVLYQRDQIVCQSMPSKLFLDPRPDIRAAVEQFDVLILHIAVIAVAAKEIQHWKAHDKLIIGDLSNPVFLNEKKEHYLIHLPDVPIIDGRDGAPIVIDKDQLLWSIKLTDGLLTNSDVMQREWKGIVSTRYIPDYGMVDNPSIKIHEPKEITQIGIQINSGGFGKLTDCGLYPEIEKALIAHPQCKVVIYGEHPHQAHLLRVPPAQKLFISQSDRDSWLGILDEIDVCLFPFSGIIDDRIGRLDILEMMLRRIPWVASNVKWLEPIHQYGWVIENQSAAWQKTLEDLMEHTSYYQNETVEGYLYALSQCLEENAHKLIEYISIINRARGAV